MASIFLSYDLEDGAHAAPIAAALEDAGHSVWWDRQIHGGAEFNCEIEVAVEQADAVVVLWSERSVKATFVTDATFRPAARELWRNPKPLHYAKRVGLLSYWQGSGNWPDFCYETDLPYDCKAEAAKPNSART